jgi:hypothetical protein
MDTTSTTTNPKLAKRRSTRSRVLSLVAERDRLRAELAANQAALHRAVRDARAAGWGVTNITRMVGVTRRAIYNIIDAEKSPRADGPAEGTATQGGPLEQHQKF